MRNSNNSSERWMKMQFTIEIEDENHHGYQASKS